MDEKELEEKLATICRRLGASAQQAPLMARKLMERSCQIAADRTISESEALDHLLRLLMQAQSGVVPEKTDNHGGSSAAEPIKKVEEAGENH